MVTVGQFSKSIQGGKTGARRLRTFFVQIQPFSKHSEFFKKSSFVFQLSANEIPS
jgi:hypothetical protein